jgi:hypothetical protein
MKFFIVLRPNDKAVPLRELFDVFGVHLLFAHHETCFDAVLPVDQPELFIFDGVPASRFDVQVARHDAQSLLRAPIGHAEKESHDFLRMTRLI